MGMVSSVHTQRSMEEIIYFKIIAESEAHLCFLFEPKNSEDVVLGLHYGYDPL